MNTLPFSAYLASKGYQCSIYNRYNNITDIYIIICINIPSKYFFLRHLGTEETTETEEKSLSTIVCYQ